MLGEQIGHDIGQITSTRILSPEGVGSPRVEVSFETNGQLLGVSVHQMATYVSVMQPNGTMSGQGQGILASTDGEIVTWAGNGVGHIRDGNNISWRGAVYYQTQSSKFSRLNGTVGVFEYETQESGKAESTTYEWK
jgi:hypothetical protein